MEKRLRHSYCYLDNGVSNPPNTVRHIMFSVLTTILTGNLGADLTITLAINLAY